MLISAVSILLGAFTNKYINLSGQLRSLTHEYRQEGTGEPRRETIKNQLRVFHHRITASHASSIFLLFAILAFMTTVLALVFSGRDARLNFVAKASLEVGLVFIVASLLLELYEIVLAKYTILYEIEDILAPPKSDPWAVLKHLRGPRR